MPLGQAAPECVVHYYECRQVLALAAEPVRNPRTDAREAHATKPCVNLKQRGRVVVSLGEARVNESHVVRMPGRVREDLGGPRTRFTPLRELEGRLHERADLGGKEARVLVETG